MPRQKDTRDYSVPRATAASLREAAERTTAALPGAQRVRATRANVISGTPSDLAAENIVADKGYVESALESVRAQFTDALGFAPAETPEFVPDPHIQRTSAGSTIVHLHQEYQGIPLFEMTRSVQFGSDRRIERVVGDNVSIPDTPTTVPALSAVDALRLAADYLARNDEPGEEDA